MPNQVTAQETVFAQTRMKLQDALAPYFAERVQHAGFHLMEIDGAIVTEGRRGPRENTLEGQEVLTSARFKTADGITHKLVLLIQPSSEGLPMVTVHDQTGGATRAVAVRDDVDHAIPALRQLIDDAFDKKLPASFMPVKECAF